MLVVMKPQATPEEIQAVCDQIQVLGFRAHPMPGAQRTAIGITGNSGALVLGDGEDRTVIAGISDFETRVDGALGRVQLTLCLVEVLQRDEGAAIGIDAKRHGVLRSGYTPERFAHGLLAQVLHGKARAGDNSEISNHRLGVTPGKSRRGNFRRIRAIGQFLPREAESFA